MRKFVWLIFVVIVAGCHKVNIQDASKDDLEAAITFCKLTNGYWQVWVCDEMGGSLKQITFSETDKIRPVWGIGGRKIYFNDTQNRLIEYDVYENTEKLVFSEDSINGSIAFSKDYSKKAVVKYRNIKLDEGNVWLCDSQDDTFEMVTYNRRSLQYQPALSSDGNLLGIVVSNGHHHTDELAVVDVLTGEFRELTHNDHREMSPTFSPDDSLIAYSSNITGDYEIFISNIDGSNKRQLTDSIGYDGYPSFSKDGLQIVYSSNYENLQNLRIIDLQGNVVRQIKFDSPVSEPCWRK